MKYKLLGKSGLRVSELSLGTMTFGEEWGWGASKEESKKIFDAYVKAGGNFIDTANRYTEGTSEKYVGEFITSNRDYFILATKYSLYTNRDDPNASGNHRKNMKQSVEASLKRLNTDYIDLYWVHAWDFLTPIEEVMRGLDDLIRSGKVIYIGISDTPAWIISKANTLAELKGWSEFVGIQVKYSLIERTVERELLPMARSLDIGVTAWGPLGGGILSGKYNIDKNAEGREKKSESVNEKNLSITEEVIKISKVIEVTPSQVALSWLLHQKGVIIPIIGAKKASQIEDNLKSIDIKLTKEQLQRLDTISKIECGFPHDFLSSDRIKDLIYGGYYSKIINHRKN